MKRSTLDHLAKVWVIWLWGYLIVGGLANLRHSTSFLAAPADSSLPFWFKAAFLNVPLQFALALSAMYLLGRCRVDRAPTFTTVLSLAVTALIFVNLVTAVWWFLVA